MKIDAVEQVLRGISQADVAARTSIPIELIEKWYSYYTRAGHRALRFTFDEGETPTLEDLQSVAQRAFPAYVCVGATSAISFFCAQFYGKNDVIHVYSHGLTDVTLVDLDAEKLGIMRSIYPQTWTFKQADAFTESASLAESGKGYDVVICDPYSTMAETVLLERFLPFYRLARRYLVLLVAQPLLDKWQIEASASALGAFMSAHHRLEVAVVDLIKRSSHQDGIYWAVIRGRGP